MTRLLSPPESSSSWSGGRSKRSRLRLPDMGDGLDLGPFVAGSLPLPTEPFTLESDILEKSKSRLGGFDMARCVGVSCSIPLEGDERGPNERRAAEPRLVLIGDRDLGGGRIDFPFLAFMTSVGSGMVPGEMTG